MALVGLGRGGEDGLKQLLRLLEAAGQLDAADSARLVVFGPAGAAQHRVAADDALYVQPSRLVDEHGATDEIARQLGVHTLDVGVVYDAEEVVGDDVAGLLEPEGGELGED